MPQLSGPEQRVLVELLVAHLSEPGHLDDPLLHSGLGTLSQFTGNGTLGAMTSDLVRALSNQYRIVEFVEAVLQGDFLKGHCPPIEAWLASNRDELLNRKNSPTTMRYILARANEFEPKHWIMAISSVVAMAAVVYFVSKLLQTLHHPDPNEIPQVAPIAEATPSGQVAMPLTDDEVERLRARLGLTSEEVQRRSRFWPRGTTINVAFLDGSSSDREFVKSVSMEWMQYVNLRLKYDDDLEASEVRVSFGQPGQSYSYLGTDCLGIDKTTATTQLGYINGTTDDRQRRFAVLHEFGHMLGFINEHQSPNADISWNWERLAQDMGSSSEMVHENFGRISADRAPREYLDKPFDSSSVLMYAPIPDEWLLTPLASAPEDRISAGDIEFAKRIYP